MNQNEIKVGNEEIQVVPRSPKRRSTGDRALLERLSALSSHRSSARSSMGGNTLSSKRSSKTNSGFIHGVDSNSTDLVNSLVAGTGGVATSNNDLATSAELYNVLRKLHDSIDQLESEDIDPMATVAANQNGSGRPVSYDVSAGDNVNADVTGDTHEPSEKHHRLSDPFLPEERELVESLLLKYGHLEPRNELNTEQQQPNHPYIYNENSKVVGDEEERMVFSSKVKIRGSSPRHSRKGSVKRTPSKSTLNSLSFHPSVTTTELNDDDTINEEETTLSSLTPTSPTFPVHKHDDSVFDSNPLANTEPTYDHQKQQQQQHQNNQITVNKNTQPTSTLLKNDRLLDHVKEMDPTSMKLDNSSKGSSPSSTPRMGGTPRTRKVSTVREFAMRFEAAQQQHQQHRHQQSRQPPSNLSHQQQQHQQPQQQQQHQQHHQQQQQQQQQPQQHQHQHTHEQQQEQQQQRR